MAKEASTTPSMGAEPLPTPDLFAPNALLTAALTLMSRALRLEWRVHHMRTGTAREKVSDEAVDVWILTEQALEMARDEAEPESVVRRLAAVFLEMMPGCVSSVDDLSAAGARIREELARSNSDPEARQLAVLAFSVSEAMIGNCQHTGVPNAGVRILPVH